MLNEVNTSVCETIYGMHPFMSFSTSFTISADDAEMIAGMADEKLLEGARKPPEEILAGAFMLYALESVDDAIDSDLEDMTAFAATVADLVQCLDLLGIQSTTHKTLAYFAEFEDESLSESVLVTLLFIPFDADDIKLK